MAKNKKQKQELLDQYRELVENSRGLIFVRTNKTTPNEINALRKDLYPFESSFKVVKNTLFRLALAEKGLNSEAITDGSYSVINLDEDIVNPSKILQKHAKETMVKTESESYEKLTVSFGFLDGEFLNESQVNELAEMPDKEQSIAMILGILDQAVAGVANVLQNPVQSVTSIIDQAFQE